MEVVFLSQAGSCSTLRVGVIRLSRLAPPSWLGKRNEGPKDGEAMINEAGKRRVKDRASAFILLVKAVAR